MRIGERSIARLCMLPMIVGSLNRRSLKEESPPPSSVKIEAKPGYCSNERKLRGNSDYRGFEVVRSRNDGWRSVA
jgi:hypothetical protein